ncbi:MAG: thiol:disulfide interchange protein, partial [Flavobacteriales bacterium]|nr:thiol:disulfide interchange protein [Flavobacteriales bacterium]
MWNNKSLLVLLFSFFALGSIGKAQILEPVKWEFTSSVDDNNQLTLSAKATIEDKWHVYATVISDDPEAFGPLPTEVIWEESADYSIVGKLKEGEYITHYDPNFEMDL